MLNEAGRQGHRQCTTAPQLYLSVNHLRACACQISHVQVNRWTSQLLLLMKTAGGLQQHMKEVQRLTDSPDVGVLATTVSAMAWKMSCKPSPVLADVLKCRAPIDAAYASDSVLETTCCLRRSCLLAAMAITMEGPTCMTQWPMHSRAVSVLYWLWADEQMSRPMQAVVYLAMK